MRFGLLLVTVGMTLTSSCIPTIENVTDSYPVDPALDKFSSAQGSVLVLPMWNDVLDCTLRTPFVLGASQITTFNRRLESRHRLGLLDLSGHGPSHYRHISGLLMFFADSRVLWVAPGRYPTENSPDVYWRPQCEAEYGTHLVGSLKAWLSSELVGPPAVLDLDHLMIWCQAYHVKISSDERKEAITFFESVSPPMSPVLFSGWKSVSAESNRCVSPTVGAVEAQPTATGVFSARRD